MQLEYIKEASLSDSYMCGELNNSSSITLKIANAIKTGVILDGSYIQEQTIQCKRSRISPLVDKVFEAFDNHAILLVYNKQVRVSTAIPFVVMQVKGVTSAYIFISDFSSISKDGSALTIDMKKLYTLMESAYIAREYYTTPQKFQKSGALLKLMASIYSGMGLRIYNREYALSLDKNVYDSVNYSLSRFYLEIMMDIKNESLAHAYAVGTCLNPSQQNLQITESAYTDAQIKNIKELVNFTSTLSLKMENLNFRYYFERWITSFGTSACLAIDAVPYMFYIVINVLLGGFLINVQTLSDMVKNTKGIHLFYAELSKII